MKRTFAAAIVALLAITAPAHAAASSVSGKPKHHNN
jgi:hypothetical protein